MDSALAYSVLHFNNGKRGHAVMFSQVGLDVGIHFHMYYCRTTPTGYVPALKRTLKSKKKRLDNPKGNKERSRRTITN